MKIQSLKSLFALGCTFACAFIASAQTVTTVFEDTFVGGSTVNSSPASPATPTVSAAAYQQLAAKGFNPAPPTIAPGHFRQGIAKTSSGFNHVQALFTQRPVTLVNVGDYLEMTLTFTNEGGLLTAQNNSTVFFGLFNASQIQPVPGGLNGSVATALAGNAQSWIGYVNRVFYTGGNNGFYTRPAKLATDSNNQDVLYNYGSAAQIGSTAPSALAAFGTGAQYTVVYRITKASATTVTLDSSLYAGGTTSGTALYTQTATSTGSLLTDTFDALAFGYRATGNDVASVMDINALKIVTTAATTIVPVITTQPLTQTKSIGESVSLSVVANGGGESPLSYQWKKNDADIPGATSDTLALASAALTDSGDYTVVITNSAGTVTSDIATLTVTAGAVAPAILTDPTGATILTGDSHTFTTLANGTAPLSYQWQKSTDAGANYTDVPGATTSSLALSNAALGDAGLYRVVVTNAQGSATSAAAALVVNEAPAITTQPVGVTLNPGAALTLSVTATGTPAATYQWKKNGADIPGATADTFSIAAVSGADAGNYTVVVSNTVGSATSTVASVAVLSSSMAVTATTPVNAATGTLPDTRLTITFNEDVTPGVSGFLRIYDASNDSVVDTIDMADATARRDTLRASSTLSTLLLPVQNKSIGGVTNFNYYPITVSGNTATLHPRNGVLTYGKSYYVTIDAGVFVNASGETFAGLASNTAWTFSTKASGPASGATQLTVAADGSGDFHTIQAALDFVPANNTTPITISIKNGTYFEQVVFQSKHFLTLLGQDRTQTVIAYPNNNTFNNVSGFYHRSTVIASSVHDVTFANLTFRNTTPQNGSQAEALIISGSSASAGKNILTACSLYSYQDTLQINRQAYVSDCYIEGDVDFLWGSGPVFFENCEIKSLLRTSGSPVVAQVRNDNTNHGYVFRNCRFTASAGVTGTFFNRIDPAGFPYSEVVILDSTFGDSANNDFLSTVTGNSNADYKASWWLLNNASASTIGTSAANIHNWTYGIVDKDGAALEDGNNDAFTNMPADATTLANYRNPAWVLNHRPSDNATPGSWTPALAPLFLTQPAAASVASTEPITLTAHVAAIPAATYQWKKDGADIPGATSATLSIASATATDSGTYTVVATNTSGSLTSDPAVVTVAGTAVAPTITTHPASQTVNEGVAVSFTVAASGTAPFTYQWKKDGADLAGATSDTLSIATAAASNAGNYTVVVTNAAGSATSNAATLTVNTPPPAGSPVTLIDDSFADGSSVNQNLSAGSIELFKSRSGTTRTDAAGSVTFAQGQTSAEAHWFHFTDVNVPQTLQVGDSLTASLTFSLTAPTNAANATIRFGMFDSKGTRVTADKTGGYSDTALLIDDLGYMGQINTDASTAAGPFTHLGRRDTITTANLFNSSADFPLLTDLQPGSTERTALAAATPYTLSMTVLRQSETVNIVTVAITGGSLPTTYTYTGTDAGAATSSYAFDWFGFRYGGSNLASAVVFTNAKVVYTPATTSVAAPVITAQPSFTGGATSLVTTTGTSTTLSVTATGAGLSYQWKKNDADIPGATSSTLALNNLVGADSGTYTVVVSNAGGSLASDPASLTVNGAGANITPDGFGANVTGGAAGTTVTVTTAAALEQYAESSAHHTILVSGTIDLGVKGRINVKSNKTIRGVDTTSTILGSLTIGNATNVIVSNLNISANTGDPGDSDGITIAASTHVLVTKCTIYDCTDGNLDVINGSDFVTVSWCKFYYTRNNGHNFSNLIGSSDTDTGAGQYRVTWHHNWWSTGAKQRMLACRFGGSHMYNNYWDCAGNDYATESRNVAEMLSEYNYYDGVKNPLNKRALLDADQSKLMTIANVFHACTGNQLVSSDIVFTPPYSYQVIDTADLAARVKTGAGNVAVDAPVAQAATISGPSSAAIGNSILLTATPAGFTPTSYQWRFKNIAISGATSGTHSIPAAAATDAGAYTVVLGHPDGGFVISSPLELAITEAPVAPAIATQPASLTVPAGATATFSVTATGGTPLTYQWKKDGADIAAATAATYSLTAAETDAASYTVVVSNAAGSVTSDAATLAVIPAFPAPAPHGYAASATGGGTATHVVVNTADDFRAQAGSDSAAVITVAGTLDLGATKVVVKSNKTIQGLDASATLIGNLELGAGVSNVVIRGLNITHPGSSGGDGITLNGATNVFITHVTFFDCADTLLRIVGGADNITVSWCEFYYTTAQTGHRHATLIGASTGETKPIRVTLAHNAYSDRVDQQMPDATFGHVHLYNNAFNPGATANTSGSVARASAQFLSEKNQYTAVASPLTKTAGGLIRAIGNEYSTTTGTAADAGTDTVFTPAYSYQLIPVTEVPALLLAGAGNIAGGASAAPATTTASISATATTVTTGASFTLNATTTASDITSRQWRLNNADITGATSASYTVSNAQATHAGIYTVALTNADGDTIVSTPVTITVNAAPAPPPPAKSGGGGGSPSLWFLAALASLASLRALRRQRS